MICIYSIVCGDILSAACQSKLHGFKKQPLKVPLKKAGVDLWVYERSQKTVSSTTER